jgi:hypothetical protein
VAYEGEEWWLAAGKEGGRDGVGRWKRIQEGGGGHPRPVSAKLQLQSQKKEKENQHKLNGFSVEKQKK